jgi:transposase
MGSAPNHALRLTEKRRRSRVPGGAAEPIRAMSVEIVKHPREAEGFHLLPRRWVIERTFAWLGRNRRLAKDFERLVEASTAMAVLAIIQMLMRRLASP